MNAILTFDTSQVIHISGFLLSLLGSVMIFGPRLGTWIKTTFDFTPIHFMIGLLMGLGMTLVLLNWETSEKRDYIVEGVYEPDDIQIPNTIQQPKKKIPPPPPPSPKKVIQKLSKVIEYVEADVVEEPTKVVDQDETAAPAVDTVSFTEPAPLILPKEEETDIGDIVIIPEQMPRFPGCESLDGDNKAKQDCATSRLLDYLYGNIKYPALARQNGIQGLAVIQFVVEPTGQISQIELMRDPGAGCGKEAVRVVNQMNEMDQLWTPGKQRGRPVRVLYTLPVKFKLQ